MTHADLMQLIPTILTIVLPPLISLSGVLYKKLIQNLPDQRRALAEQIVHMVVTAIEQAAANAAPGADKKQAAIILAQRTLRDLGLTVSPDTVAIMVEATVYAMKQAQAYPNNITQSAYTPVGPNPFYPMYHQNYYPVYAQA